MNCSIRKIKCVKSDWTYNFLFINHILPLSAWLVRQDKKTKKNHKEISLTNDMIRYMENLWQTETLLEGIRISELAENKNLTWNSLICLQINNNRKGLKRHLYNYNK